MGKNNRREMGKTNRRGGSRPAGERKPNPIHDKLPVEVALEKIEEVLAPLPAPKPKMVKVPKEWKE